MKFFKLFRLLSLILLVSSCVVRKPQTTSVGKDPQAESFISQGLELMGNKDYLNAARLFTLAGDRPFHFNTTYAMYLGALSFYYEKDYDQAEAGFRYLISTFPKTNYLDDARFHLALIQFEKGNDVAEQQGVLELLEISAKPDRKLREMALTAVKNHLTNKTSAERFDYLSRTAPEVHKPIFSEVMILRQTIQQGKQFGATMYQDYLAQGNPPSPMLDSMLSIVVKEQPKRPEQDVIRVALCLPMYMKSNLINYSSQIPSKSKPWLEYYEGLAEAIAQYENYSGKKIILRIFDTERDTSVTRLMTKDLDSFFPHVVIGGVYNNTSEILAEWSTKRGVVHLVPFSRTLPYQTYPNTILLNPPLYVHGQQMGSFAKDVLKLTRIAIFSDGTTKMDDLAQGFLQGYDTTGVTRSAFIVTVDSVYDRGKDELAGKDEIPRAVEALQDSSINGVYIPFDNEATAGLVLGQISNYNMTVKVMGAHYWKNYQIIDRELKESYRLLFSSSNMYDSESLAYKDFYKNYLKKYSYPPPDWSIEGYDLGTFILPILDKYEAEMEVPLITYFRLMPSTSTIHTNYFFDKQRTNQYVNIGEFREGGVFKVTDALINDPLYWILEKRAPIKLEGEDDNKN